MGALGETQDRCGQRREEDTQERIQLALAPGQTSLYCYLDLRAFILLSLSLSVSLSLSLLLLSVFPISFLVCSPDQLVTQECSGRRVSYCLASHWQLCWLCKSMVGSLSID